MYIGINTAIGSNRYMYKLSTTLLTILMKNFNQQSVCYQLKRSVGWELTGALKYSSAMAGSKTATDKQHWACVSKYDSLGPGPSSVWENIFHLFYSLASRKYNLFLQCDSTLLFFSIAKSNCLGSLKQCIPPFIAKNGNLMLSILWILSLVCWKYEISAHSIVDATLAQKLSCKSQAQSEKKTSTTLTTWLGKSAKWEYYCSHTLVTTSPSAS